MTSYKEAAIRKYYDFLVDNLAAMDARHILEDVALIEKEKENIQAIEDKAAKADSILSPDSTASISEKRHFENFMATKERQIQDHRDNIQEIEERIESLVEKRVQLIKSLPNIEELIKDVE